VQVVGERSDEQLPDETEGYDLFHSSGTTGMPKGIERAHDFPPFGTRLVIDKRMHAAFGFDDSAAYLCPAPLDLLKLPEDERKRYDVSSLKVVVHAAAPCPPDVKEQMIEWFGPIMLEYYTGSEGASMTMISSAATSWLQAKLAGCSSPTAGPTSSCPAA
jgi:long-chain acyl-CoA synthetase